MLELLTLKDWLKRDLPAVEYVCDPWLPVAGIAMIYGTRGVGKTNIGLGLALSIAEGEPFLDFRVPKARKVLYMDGEMQRNLVQARMQKFMTHTPRPRALHNLVYANYADYPRGFGDLSAEGRGRTFIEEAINQHDADVLILDNKSSLMRAGDENNAQDYQSFNDWLLSLRKYSVTTVLVHHAGKRRPDGTYVQRGTSRVEDTMDCIVQLDKGGKPADGTIPVRWTFEKYRSFTPDEETFDFNVRYDDDAGLAWLELSEGAKEAPEWIAAAHQLRNAGMSLRDIQQQLGLNSHVTLKRWLDRCPENPIPSAEG